VIALFVPVLAAGFRRMQDTGRPGWYFVIPSIYNLLMRIFGVGQVEMNPETGMPMEMPSTGGMMVSALLGLIGLVLAIVFIYWLTRPSEPEPNAYGAPPQA
jgi:uncharacterized membrane protein YhaH (DUF805 family)